MNFDAPPHYWYALTQVPQIGGATLHRLLHHFGSLTAILAATPTQLARVPRLSAEVVMGLQTVSLPQAQAELARLQRQGIRMLNWAMAHYPARLHELTSPPPLLLRRGEPLPLTNDSRTVAIVGSRQVSQRGLTEAHALAYHLAAAGVTIVSGLALGIDTAAHRGAMQLPNGRTVAVLGSGVCRLYPAENRPLARQISQQGTVLSEQPPYAAPTPAHLMRRNRLIAALSQAVIVVEASATSGALETARQAHRLQRTVFALPDSPGTEMLLQNGATRLAWQASDIKPIVASLQTPQQVRLF